MLQLMTDDSGHFTQPELSLWLALMPEVIIKDHGQMLIESAQHSWPNESYFAFFSKFER